MAVGQRLGIETLVAEADASWPLWTVSEPAVARFGSVSEVERWRSNAGHDEIEEMFTALGRLTRTDASHRAVAVMAKLLMPGIHALASRRCRGDVPRAEVESVVAGYVWTVILDYPWQAPTDAWIPAAILRSVGRAVDREFGWGDRGDRTWRSRVHVDADIFEQMISRSQQDQAVQASGVYWWAVSKNLVDAADLELLLQLAVIATDQGAAARSSAGITSRAACGQYATTRGLTVNQVQYRARQALGTLRANTHTTVSV